MTWYSGNWYASRWWASRWWGRAAVYVITRTQLLLTVSKRIIHQLASARYIQQLRRVPIVVANKNTSIIMSKQKNNVEMTHEARLSFEKERNNQVSK